MILLPPSTEKEPGVLSAIGDVKCMDAFAVLTVVKPPDVITTSDQVKEST